MTNIHFCLRLVYKPKLGLMGETRKVSCFCQKQTKTSKENQNILEKINNRNEVLRNRQILWDTYTLDLDKLTAWLRDMEREKQMLNLKHVAQIRLPKILRKIQTLLEKIPSGEKLYKKLVSLQYDLKINFSSSVQHSVKSELHNCQVKVLLR